MWFERLRASCTFEDYNPFFKVWYIFSRRLLILGYLILSRVYNIVRANINYRSDNVCGHWTRNDYVMNDAGAELGLDNDNYWLVCTRLTGSTLAWGELRPHVLYVIRLDESENCPTMLYLTLSDGSSYWASGAGCRPRPSVENLTPLDGRFKLYMNPCHRDHVNIFFINMHNLLFRLLILFDVFGELQLIYYISKFGAPLKLLAPLWNSRHPSSETRIVTALAF